MSKLIELEFGYLIDSETKVVYNTKMEIVSAQEYATICDNKRRYAESYLDSNASELDELDREGQLLQVFSNENQTQDEHGNLVMAHTAYYIAEPTSFNPLDTYQFFRESIFSGATTVQYRAKARGDI